MSRYGFRFPIYVPDECARVRELISTGAYEEAWRVLTVLARLGHAKANALLGYLHLRGAISGERNLVDARHYCKFAVERGDAYGEYALAWLEYEEWNEERAVQLMMRSSKKGFLPAIADLGRIAAMGTNYAASNPRASLRQCRAAFMRGYMCLPPTLALLARSKKLSLWTRALCVLWIVVSFPVMLYGFKFRLYSKHSHFHFAKTTKSPAIPVLK